MSKDITFIIAAQVDSQDRLDNLDITINHIVKNFPESAVVILESDITEKLAGRYKDCQSIFVRLLSGEVFNKMKLYNKGASLASSRVLCFVDVDVPPSKTAILKAAELILQDRYDVVYPYGRSEGYNIPKPLHKEVCSGAEVYTFDQIKHPWLLKKFQISYVESGGVIVFNADSYRAGGGGNETFVGWGCEDDEMLYRFDSLGYKIGRVYDAILLHLEHTRKTGTAWHAAFAADGEKYEVANRIKLSRIKRMSRDELLNEVALWDNFNLTPKKDSSKTVSVIISGSYLESHPEITFMKEVIESLELTGISYDTHILLSHDKIKPGTEGAEEKEKSYIKYFENLEEYVKTSKFKNIEIVQAPEWGHLTRTLKHAVSKVTTKYMLVLQHDIHIRREIPVLDMIELMEKNSRVKHLRFNVRRNHPTFMWWDGYKGGKRQFAEEEVDGMKLCFTPAWSDQNHLATKEYYENVVFPDCTNTDGELIYDFMENRLNGLCHHNHERYGTYIYGEYGAPRTSRHSDGRKSSPEADED